MTPFEAYQIYVSVKCHFYTDDYNYFQFNGKIKNTTLTSYENRADKTFFIKISKKFQVDEYVDFLFSNFLQDRFWIGELLEDAAHENYVAWRKTVESMSYVFKKDVTYLLEKNSDLNSYFKSSGGNYPPIVQEMLHKSIEMETVTILNIMLDFVPQFDKMIKDDLIWPQWKRKILKYQPRLCERVDVAQFKKLLKTLVNN